LSYGRKSRCSKEDLWYPRPTPSPHPSSISKSATIFKPGIRSGHAAWACGSRFDPERPVIAPWMVDGDSDASLLRRSDAEMTCLNSIYTARR